MKITFEDLSNKLKDKNIRLSHQRLKVLEYLVNNRCHPTVEQIYTVLHKEIPTLSKTTVYNTLNTLIDAGLVKLITIDENETRYDIDTTTHGHFKCESCGDIYDFKINIDSLESEDLSYFKVSDKNIYFNGLCPKCIKQGNNMAN